MFLLSDGKGAVRVARLKVTAHTIAVSANALYEGLLKPQELRVQLWASCETNITKLRGTTAEQRSLMLEYLAKLFAGEDGIPPSLSGVHAEWVYQTYLAEVHHIHVLHPIRARHLVAA